jgi:hypothetical protein
LTNEQVFNEPSQPLIFSMNNTYRAPGIVAPPENNAGRNGLLFSTTASASGTVALGLLTVNCSLRINNASANRTLFLSRLIVSIGGSSLLSNVSGSAVVTRGGTLTSPAAAVPVNSNFGSAQTSTMTVQTSTSAITGGTALISFQLAPGALELDYSGQIVVPPGQALCINAQASSSSIGLAILAALSASWWEA